MKKIHQMIDAGTKNLLDPDRVRLVGEVPASKPDNVPLRNISAVKNFFCHPC
jgi:hypothetical protein